jgi:tetratricopeptide (TPR) repeat protein
VGTGRSAGAPPALVITPVPDIPIAPNAVAVLPFRSIPDDPENVTFAAGLVEQIWNNLSTVGGLRLTGPTSAFKADGEGQTIPEIGRQLGVSRIVTGSVLRQGDQFVASVQLMDAATDRALSTVSFTGRLELGSVFDIASQVASELGLEPIGNQAEASEPYRPRPGAYGFYLAGRKPLRLRTKASLEGAIAQFDEAIALDPDFAKAHIERADAYVMLTQYGGLTDIETKQALEEAQWSVDEVERIDRTLPQRYRPEGAIAYLNRDIPRAEAALELAAELSDDFLSHNFYGTFLLERRERDKARAEFERARELGPLEAPPHENLARMLLEDGRLDEALSMATKAVELDPGYPFGHWVRGEVLLAMGRGDVALEHFDKMVELNPNDDTRAASVASAYQAVGRNSEAEEIHLRRVTLGSDRSGPHVRLGDFYREIGRFNDAAASYERAIPLDERTQRAKSLMVRLELDRGEGTTAERLVTEIEAVTRNRFAQIARLNFDMYHGRYADSAAVALELAEGFPAADYGQWEPVGYFGVLAGQAADSRQFFEATFPALFTDDDPSVYGDNLTAAIDLAAVLMRAGEQVRADLLLLKCEAFIDSVAEVQRRNQFRAAPMEIYALQRRTDDAFDAMELAFDDGWRSGWWRLEHKPHFDSIRDDPRFQDMIDKLKAATAG